MLEDAGENVLVDAAVEIRGNYRLIRLQQTVQFDAGDPLVEGRANNIGKAAVPIPIAFTRLTPRPGRALRRSIPAVMSRTRRPSIVRPRSRAAVVLR